MPRIAGTDIPDNKPIRIALRYVFGVGPKIAEDLLQEVLRHQLVRHHVVLTNT